MNLKLDRYFSMFDSLNSSKVLIGIMIVFNIGSKFLIIDMSKSQQQFFKNIIIRRLTLFCIFFAAYLRDIGISLILTATFIIAFNVFNEDSKYSILSKTHFMTIFTQRKYGNVQKNYHRIKKKINI